MYAINNINDKNSFELVKSCSSDSANTIIQRERHRLKRSQHHASSTHDGIITGSQYGRPKLDFKCFTCGADPSLILEPHIPSTIDRIVIIGGGAIGVFVGCCLLDAKQLDTSNTPQVTFLVRNHQDVERHARKGFAAHSIVDTDFRASISPSEAKNCLTTDPSCLREASCIFVATKRTSNSTVHRWCAMYNVTCPVVFLQIGLQIRDDLTTAARLMGPTSDLGSRGVNYEVIEAIILMNVDMNKETGIVTVVQPIKDTLIVLDGKQPSAQAVSELFYGSVLTVRPETERDFVSLQAANLQLNLINAVNALSGKTVAATLREYEYRLVLSYCVDESREVFQAHGIPVRAAKKTDLQLKLMSSVLRSWNMIFLPVMNSTLELLPKSSSLAHDIANCVQQTEIEFINGAIVRLGRLAGIDCPVNAKLVELVQRAEALRMGSPELSARSLLTEIGLAPQPRIGESSRGSGVHQLLSFGSLRMNSGTSSSLTSGRCTRYGDSGRSVSRPERAKTALPISMFSSDSINEELVRSPPSSPRSLPRKQEHSPCRHKATEGITWPYMDGVAAMVTVDRKGDIRLWT
jgi:2-dehydropantoate 2-reductase